MNDNVFLDTNLWVYFFAKDPLDLGQLDHRHCFPKQLQHSLLRRYAAQSID